MKKSLVFDRIMRRPDDAFLGRCLLFPRVAGRWRRKKICDNLAYDMNILPAVKQNRSCFLLAGDRWEEETPGNLAQICFIGPVPPCGQRCIWNVAQQSILKAVAVQIVVKQMVVWLWIKNDIRVDNSLEYFPRLGLATQIYAIDV